MTCHRSLFVKKPPLGPSTTEWNPIRGLRNLLNLHRTYTAPLCPTSHIANKTENAETFTSHVPLRESGPGHTQHPLHLHLFHNVPRSPVTRSHTPSTPHLSNCDQRTETDNDPGREMAAICSDIVRLSSSFTLSTVTLSTIQHTRKEMLSATWRTI